MSLFDTHTNLHSERFASDLPEVLARARDVGVSGFIAVCDRLDNYGSVLELARSHADIWCSVGVHPHHAKDHVDLSAERLLKMAVAKQVRAIGETGLDYHHGYSPVDEQKAAFRVQIEAAAAAGLPVIVHSREADSDMREILAADCKPGESTLLMHCYTGGHALAEEALALGAFFSVSGILAFRNAGPVREVMRRVPLERVVLETDCPYLAPPPHRGRRNEPAFLPLVCAALAELHDTDIETVARLTTANARALFGVETAEETT